MANLDEVKKERKNNERRREPRREESDIEKSLVCVRRVTKVVKGGRTMRFSALVVVSDKKGSVGLGIGKAGEVPNAIEKATQNAKKNMKKINILGTTIPHEAEGKFGTSRVLLLPAKEGTGVIAGGSCRSVIELAGIKDIVTKIHGSTNKINCVKATVNGLTSIMTKEQIAARRGVSVESL